MRAPRYGNLIQSWTIPAHNDGESFMNFPEWQQDNETQKRVEWWNAQLAMHASDAGLKIAAGGHTEIQLSEKPGWLSF